MRTSLNGMVEWVDLSTPDTERAQGFYQQLLGWSFEIQHSEIGDYVIAASTGRPVAGMMAPGPGTTERPSVWTVFVHVDNIAATVASITESGGTVHTPPFEIPDGERVAVVSDRTGAMFSIATSGPTPEPAYFSEEPGGVCWVELMTSDVDDAVDF